MKTTSAVESSSATLGGGSKVWEFVPSGTMPVIATRSPPMFATMLVIGATVVATASLPEPSASRSPAHPASSAVPASTAPNAARICRTGTLSRFFRRCNRLATATGWQHAPGAWQS